MADFDDIRRGLAAKLRTVLSEADGHISPYFRLKPPTPCLQVAGITNVVKTDFDDGRTYTVTIEGVFALGDEIQAQIQLDDLIDAVPDALEGNTAAGWLFERYQDDNTTLSGQPAACDGVSFTRYRGAGRQTLDTVEVWIASWEFEVVT